MIEMTYHVNHLLDLWQRCIFSGIEALEFSCIYQYPRKACDRRRISGRRYLAYYINSETNKK